VYEVDAWPQPGTPPLYIYICVYEKTDFKKNVNYQPLDQY